MPWLAQFNMGYTSMYLGAGLDTFAYRNPYPPQDLHVFEVDHPATQAWKQERLQAVGIPVPASLSFAALDFETGSLEDQLPKAGFKTGEPAFFSWLGVTMLYLPRGCNELIVIHRRVWPGQAAELFSITPCIKSY